MFKLAAIEQMIYSATGFAFFGGRPRGRRGRLGLSLSALESSDSLSAGASVGSTACSVAALAFAAAFGCFATGASTTGSAGVSST